METIVRYSTELQLKMDFNPPVLEFFVGPYGIRSKEPTVQLRSWYLFERLLVKIHPYISSMVEQVLLSFMDLLVIHITPKNAMFQSQDSDSDNESEQDVVFDSQLYLYQSAGLLIACMSKLDVAETLLQSLISNIKSRFQIVNPDQLVIMNIHHTIMAIGDIAKGFDSASRNSGEQLGTRIFGPAAETINEALERFEEYNIVRDATRYAFARLVNVMGRNILEKIPPLIGGLLRKSTTSELIDFLPFLGQLIHKFKVFCCEDELIVAFYSGFSG
jgi:exportin-T